VTEVAGVVLSATGEPLADVRVLFSLGPVALPDVAALTDDRGRFSLTAPAPGAYELTAAAGDRTTTRQLRVDPGDDRVELELRIDL